MNDFLNKLPSMGSVEARLGMMASRTPEGELNTLLNDAFKTINALNEALRNSSGGK